LEEIKMKRSVFILVSLLLFLPSQAEAARSEQQDQQLQEIQDYISWCHQAIENYYANQLFELQQRVQGEIRLLEVADKAVYAPLVAQAKVARTVLHIYNYGSYRDGINKSAERFAVAQSLIAEKKSELLAKLEWEALCLERQKQYALNVTLPELEERLKENLVAAKPKPAAGVVAGLVYSKDARSAVVDGTIVHEGDIIRGARVLRIDKDAVEFEKSARSWKQKVGQAPPAYWK
jgi:hypothetical protein